MENNENSDLRRQYVSFKKAIHEGNWGSFIGFLRDHPDAVKNKISSDGSTALHIAVLAVRMKIVEELLNRIHSMQEPEKILQIKDDDEVTVLGCSALVGNIEIATCIIKKCPTLLSIGNGTDKLIPVVFALVYNSDGVEMARYLYSETCKDDLMPDMGVKGVNGATFITQCIYAKAFGNNSI
ncbi:ankyrin repeat-containing protein npr4 [Fagus crenata]